MRLFGYELTKAKKPQMRANLVPSWQSGIDYVDPQDKQTLVNAFKTWAYICVNRNGMAVAKQRLRLFLMKNKSKKTIAPIRTVSDAMLKELENNHYDKVRKASSSFSDFEIVEVAEHPFLDMMTNINPFYNKTDFLYLTDVFMELTGDSYWHITRNRQGMPIQLWALPSQNMSIIPDERYFIGKYRYNNGDSHVDYKPEDIIQFKFPNPADLYYGKSPLSAVATAYNVQEDLNNYTKEILENMGVISGFFTTEQSLDDNSFDRLSGVLKNSFSGKGRRGKTPLLDNGLMFNKAGTSPSELLMTDAYSRVIQEIVAAYGLHMALLTSESVNRSNAEAAMYIYVRDTIQPRLQFISEKINEKLLPMYDENLFCAFDNPVVQDSELELKKNIEYRKWGIITGNEVRKKEGYPEINEDTAEKLIIPQNYDTDSNFGGNGEQ